MTSKNFPKLSAFNQLTSLFPIMSMNMDSVTNWFGQVSRQVTDMMSIPPEDAEPAPDSENREQREGSPPMAHMQRRASEVTQQATEQAKSLGASLYSYWSGATKTLEETTTSLTKDLTKDTILSQFDDEQRKFIDETKTKDRTAYAAVAPWVGYNEETLMKKQILSLSLDSRNFLRDPPAGTEFAFDMSGMYPIAVATLQEDPNLRKMRFQLVPKQLTEERFWRNYFYRVSLIKQSAQLSTLAATTSGGSGSGSLARSGSSASGSNPEQKVEPQLSPGLSNEEFLATDDADAPQVSEAELNQVREQLGMVTGNNGRRASKDENTSEQQPQQPITDQPSSPEKEEDWENELLADLNDYELVSEQTNKTGEEWEQEISDLLVDEGEKKEEKK